MSAAVIILLDLHAALVGIAAYRYATTRDPHMFGIAVGMACLFVVTCLSATGALS